MKEEIKKYIELETLVLTREERRKLTEDIVQRIESESWNLADVLQLIAETEQSNIYIRQPIFEKVIYPILQDGTKNKKIEAIKSLVKLEHNYYVYQRKFSSQNFATVRQLIEQGLKIDKTDKELLELYEKELNYRLDFSIHEVPAGVLYGMDGATIEECDKLLDELEKYKEVCRNLALDNDEDRKELIEECDFHFHNYKKYLLSKSKFENYTDFLNQIVNKQ